jgi:hypothetical protein
MDHPIPEDRGWKRVQQCMNAACGHGSICIIPRSYSLVANQSTLNGRSVWCLAEEPSSRIAQTLGAGHQVQYCTANSTTCDWPQTSPGCGGKSWAVCYSEEAVAPFQYVCRNPRRKLIGLAFGIEISSKDDRILHSRGYDRILRCSEAVNIFGKTAVMPFTTFPYFFCHTSSAA